MTKTGVATRALVLALVGSGLLAGCVSQGNGGGDGDGIGVEKNIEATITDQTPIGGATDNGSVSGYVYVAPGTGTAAEARQNEPRGFMSLEDTPPEGFEPFEGAFAFFYSGDVILQRTVTDANGFFIFYGLPLVVGQCVAEFPEGSDYVDLNGGLVSYDNATPGAAALFRQEIDLATVNEFVDNAGSLEFTGLEDVTLTLDITNNGDAASTRLFLSRNPSLTVNTLSEAAEIVNVSVAAGATEPVEEVLGQEALDVFNAALTDDAGNHVFYLFALVDPLSADVVIGSVSIEGTAVGVIDLQA